MILERFKNFLKSSENLQSTTLEKTTSTKQQRQQQQQHTNHFSQNFHSRIKHPGVIVDRIVKSFRGCRTQSTFHLNERSLYDDSRCSTFDAPAAELSHHIFPPKNNKSTEFRGKISSNHDGVIPEYSNRIAVFNQNLKSKTFVLIGSPRRKPRLLTPKSKLVPSNWDDGQDTLVFGMPGRENMAERHALHKCHRGRCRRLRNAKVRRRLSFGNEVIEKNNECLGGAGVFLCHFPVAV